jgi:hypothetical protein
MSEPEGPPAGDDNRTCRWTNQASALAEFASFTGKTQSAHHIKPLHWYVACRLVIEGGFHPDDITPRPPFVVRKSKGRFHLVHSPESAGHGERTVLGGLKTKNVDVVVTRSGIGPVLAVSCKGVTGAFRNLTNRMEETIGECTNLHITYPALALGYFVVIRANRKTEEALAIELPDGAEPGKVLAANDLALTEGGEPVMGMIRFHNALRELAGRRGIRDDVSGYEAVAMSMVDMSDTGAGAVLDSYPPIDSALRLERFFDTLYLRYDERFVFSAPDLNKVTRRAEWAPDSPAFTGPAALPGLDYPPRLYGDHAEPEE